MKKFILLLTTLLFIAALLWFADFDEVWNRLLYLPPLRIIFVCLMQLMTLGMIQIQWYRIAWAMGMQISFGKMMYIHFIGTFVESVTPSVKAGGEAAKVYMLKRRMGIPLAKAVALVGFQKTVSLLTFLFLNLLATSWFLITVARDGAYFKLILGSFLFLFLCLFLLLALIYFPRRVYALCCFILGKENRKWKRAWLSFQQALDKGVSHKRMFLEQSLISLGIWGFFAVKAMYLAKGFNMDITIIEMAVATYLAYMVAMVPLLPGGLGSFEGSMVFLLSPLGISIHEGLAFALVFRFVTFWFVFLVSGLYVAGYELRRILKPKSVSIS